jgi:hypothetical protein
MLPMQIVTTEETSIQVGVRLSQALYNRLVKRQQEAKKLTGFEPTLSDVVRLLLEQGLETKKKR